MEHNLLNYYVTLKNYLVWKVAYSSRWEHVQVMHITKQLSRRHQVWQPERR
jgi:hypothetical protein